MTGEIEHLAPIMAEIWRPFLHSLGTGYGEYLDPKPQKKTKDPLQNPIKASLKPY
jgi:hypothetical protein